MKPNLYEAARALTTAGFSADIYFNPSQITNRLKKSVQRQIICCSAIGGYKSQSARIASQLMSQYEIPHSKSYWGLHVQFQSKESQSQAVAILQADLAAYLLDAPFNADYEKRRALNAIETINRGEEAYVHLHISEFSKQLLNLMTDSLPPEVRAKAAALAARLDDPTPIKINLKNWSI
jgi:hypothetical protein